MSSVSGRCAALAREILGHAADLGVGREPAHPAWREAGPGKPSRHLAPRKREEVFSIGRRGSVWSRQCVFGE